MSLWYLFIEYYQYLRAVLLEEVLTEISIPIPIRMSHKNTFFEFRFGGRITGVNGYPEATKNFQRYRPINDT